MAPFRKWLEHLTIPFIILLEFERVKKQFALAALTVCVSLCVMSLPVMAQEKTAEAKRTRIEVVVDLGSTVQSNDVQELKLDNSQLTDLEVEQVVAHGTRVSKGQTLLSLKKEELQKKAEEMRQAHRLAELTFEEKQLAVAQAEETNRMAREAKEREKEQAEADFRYWEETTWPQRWEDLEEGRQNSRDFYEDAMEEFEQLKKMYEEDELVEESEKLVLRRQERDLKRAKRNFERSEQSYERTKTVGYPRQEQQYRDSHRQSMLRLERELAALPNNVERENIETEKAEIAFQKSAENMEQLEQELKQTKIVAPFDGIVYHGNWPVSGKTVNIEADGKVAAKQTLLTICSLEDLHLQANVTEDQLSKLEAGMNGYAIPAAFPKQVTQVRISQLDSAPSSTKSFACKLALDSPPAQLLPGMSCAAKIQAYRNDDALTVPDAAIFSDDGMNHFVFVSVPIKKTAKKEGKDKDEESEGKDGDDSQKDSDSEKSTPAVEATKTVKTKVRVGVSSGGQSEILSGLNEGDKVLLSRPSDQ